MTVVAVVCLTALVTSGAICLLRLVRGDDLADRAIALDTFTACFVSGIAVSVAWSGDGVAIDVALAIGLLGFLATVSISRFMGSRGA